MRTDAGLWTHAGNKFVIATVHGELLEIEAQYNPKELGRTTTASWQPHPNTSTKQSPTGDDGRWLEYGSTEPRTLTVELLFDGYEQGISVAPIVDKLERLTIPVDMRSRNRSERRPQICVAVWGKQKLRCVVTSVTTKLTMFSPSGDPLRATCTVALKEVDAIAMMKADDDHTDIKSRDDQITRAHNKWRPNPRDAKMDFNDLE